MNPENLQSSVLSAREAEILLEPQSHAGEVEGQLNRMVNSLMDEVYLSHDREHIIGQDLGLDTNYPVISSFAVRTGEGRTASLEIGSSRLPATPSEKTVKHYIDYEDSSKIVFIEDGKILTVAKSALGQDTLVARTQAGHVRREMIHPLEYALLRRALDAAEHKRVIEPSGYSSAK